MPKQKTGWEAKPGSKLGFEVEESCKFAFSPHPTSLRDETDKIEQGEDEFGAYAGISLF